MFQFTECSPGLSPIYLNSSKFFFWPFQYGSSVAVFLSLCVCGFTCGVLSIFIPRLSFFWCPWKALLRDCGISWLSSLAFIWPCPYTLNVLKFRALYIILFCLNCAFKTLSEMAKSVDHDQTAPEGAVWSGSALFAYIILSETLVFEIVWHLLYVGFLDLIYQTYSFLTLCWLLHKALNYYSFISNVILALLLFFFFFFFLYKIIFGWILWWIGADF